MNGGMSNANRAKQFAPFSALRGLEDKIWQSNQPQTERSYLGEDAQTELDQTLHRLQKGESILVEYYFDRQYRKLAGRFRRIDLYARLLYVEEQRIPLDDIREIRRDGFLVE